jgi:hypothetical protein
MRDAQWSTALASRSRISALFTTRKYRSGAPFDRHQGNANGSVFSTTLSPVRDGQPGRAIAGAEASTGNPLVHAASGSAEPGPILATLSPRQEGQLHAWILGQIPLQGDGVKRH